MLAAEIPEEHRRFLIQEIRVCRDSLLKAALPNNPILKYRRNLYPCLSLKGKERFLENLAVIKPAFLKLVSWINIQ